MTCHEKIIRRTLGYFPSSTGTKVTTVHTLVPDEVALCLHCRVKEFWLRFFSLSLSPHFTKDYCLEIGNRNVSMFQISIFCHVQNCLSKFVDELTRPVYPRYL